MPDLEVCDGLPTGLGRAYHARASSHTHRTPGAISLMLVFWALAPHLGHASVREWSTGMFAANALGLVGAGSLHLAFLSPAAWRRWIAERAASQESGSPRRRRAVQRSRQIRRRRIDGGETPVVSRGVAARFARR